MKFEMKSRRVVVKQASNLNSGAFSAEFKAFADKFAKSTQAAGAHAAQESRRMGLAPVGINEPTSATSRQLPSEQRERFAATVARWQTHVSAFRQYESSVAGLEQLLLANLIENKSAVDHIKSLLAPRHFGNIIHAKIYDQIAHLGYFSTEKTLNVKFNLNKTNVDIIKEIKFTMNKNINNYLDYKKMTIAVVSLGQIRENLEAETNPIGESAAQAIGSVFDALGVDEKVIRDLAPSTGWEQVLARHH